MHGFSNNVSGSRGCLLVLTTGTAAFVSSGGVLSPCFSLGGSNPGGSQWSLVCRPASGGNAWSYPDSRVLRNHGDPEEPLCSSALLGSAGSEAPGPREGIQVLHPGLLLALHKVPATYHKICVSTGWDRGSRTAGTWRRRWSLRHSHFEHLQCTRHPMGLGIWQSTRQTSPGHGREHPLPTDCTSVKALWGSSPAWVSRKGQMEGRVPWRGNSMCSVCVSM